MSGVQGIIVCGEASESDEEEEFCAAMARGQLVNQKPGAPTPEGCTVKQYVEKKQLKQQQQQHYQQQVRRTHHSLLHHKLWETNASLERNLTQCIHGPLTEQTNRISRLITTIPAAQTSTLSAHSSLSQTARNLSHINFLLGGLANNPLASLKAP
ncbi:uncharacterized protein LOC121861300 isoform X2 [Homarus americanus]|uniref:Putative Biogenesis of lysosome-related organelles complex 1 subunit 3-containing protein n=2 Tax=Homarus americanus TaxID=6706 RepID=A0A8J5TIS3_HOMAM|nr:uncharacterized protein LOC121861300 isoform X2 [Homarus americanus]KAG7172832.1 putative Biogenesis of lysosome-related organelles complex 1 subunit 3-containing protein [Homarus americanus]